MPGHRLTITRLLLFGWLAAILLGFAPPAKAQQSDVVFENLNTAFVGLGGKIRRGTWTPVRLDLFNESPEVREVICRWVLADADGDRVIGERTVPLSPQRAQSVWLYADPPLSGGVGNAWLFQIIDKDSSQLLAQRELTPGGKAVIEPHVNLVAVCGSNHMGLMPYAARWSTTHEPVSVVMGLELQDLPDRWYGLSSISTLVWSSVGGGDPLDTAVSDETVQAVREWVYRGGHLVIVLPTVGETWTASAFQDIIGIGPASMSQVEAVPPADVYGAPLFARVPIPMTAFDLPEGSGYSVIMTADTVATEDQPSQDYAVAVGRRFGFGQVTLVGLDATNTTGIARSLPNTNEGNFRVTRLWTRLLGWRASKTEFLLTPNYLDSDDGKKLITEMSNRGGYSGKNTRLGEWIDNRIAKQATTGATLFLAIVLFLIYGAASMLTFPVVLRKRGWDRYSWLLFVGMISFFTTVAWGGAALMRPSKTAATHFTVLDIDGNTNVVHSRSWVSLFVSRFGPVPVACPSENDGIFSLGLTNTLASPGMALSIEDPGYPDTQTYNYDAGQPDRMAFPIRATTKPFVLDFLGRITTAREGLGTGWDMPTCSIKPADSGLPRGTVTHRFADALENVLVIYCPGGSGPVDDDSWKPIVWTYRSLTTKPVWEPGDMLTLPTSRGQGQILWKKPAPVLASATGNNLTRAWGTEGYLGQLTSSRGVSAEGQSNATLVDDLTLLSFYDALPPPEYDTRFGNHGYNYERNILRDIDLTPLLTGRRIIIIGHLPNSACPTPFSVDGDDVKTEGWTVVRWIYDY